MKKLSVLLLVMFVSAVFVGCGDSKDLGDSKDSGKSQVESSADTKDCQAKYGNSIADLYRCLSEAGLDTAHIKSKSYPVDCSYQKDISALFHHKDDCSILDQEPRPKCKNAVFPKEVEEWANCGTPSVSTIKANSIKEAYDIAFMYENKEIWFENLPLQNVRKDLSHNDCCFVQYSWENDKHLELIYGFDSKDRCDYKIFDLKNGYVRVLEVEDIWCPNDSGKSTSESNNESTQDLSKFTEALSDDDAKTRLDELKQYISFIVSPQDFSELDALAYDRAKVQIDDENSLEFIDLCKHRVVAGVKYQSVIDYESNCLISDIHKGELDGIRKYFIKAKSIDEAFGLYYKTKDKAPKGNAYIYCCDEGLKEDGVGTWYIWDNGRLWVGGSGYDSGDVAIFTQKGEIVEVIYRWSIAG